MSEQMVFDENGEYKFEVREPIKGFPELRWTGKRPFKSTMYYPAQLKESYGTDVDGWMNKIFWGDNLQVMSHLLKQFRGQIDLIYIDPPFDSKADYKKKVEIRGIGKAENDNSSFEEKQYGDIWTNDEYLQFMYERLVLLKELLSDKGSIFLHCDWHKSHYLRIILDEIFGADCFQNEIVWQKLKAAKKQAITFGNVHDTIFYYTKNPTNFYHEKQYTEYSEELINSHYNRMDEDGRRYTDDSFTQNGQGPARYFGEKGLLEPPAGKHWIWSQERIDEGLKNGTIIFTSNGMPRVKRYLDERKGLALGDIWSDVFPINSQAIEANGYPTQKPEVLIERIINSASKEGDLVFDCFMGSGTTQAVAMKLGRRFIGADINLGAIQTTIKRLIGISDELNSTIDGDTKYTGFEVYNVNNYDFFRNPIEARDLIISALDIDKFTASSVYDGELDGRMVKIMPVNRIATKADLAELIANMPYKTFEQRKADNPNEPVERITLVCMGHEPDLKAHLIAEVTGFKLDVEIVDILRDKADLQLKREAEAVVVRKGNKLVIEAFYPMNLMQKLSLQKEFVDDWKQLVESVMVDFNYDGAVLQPTITDIPGKNEFVLGEYEIPETAGTIRVKITDLLSESLEIEVE